MPSNTGSANFNGSNNYYSGLIYSPEGTSVNFNGAAGGYVVLVFGAWNVNGAAVFDFASPPPGKLLVEGDDRPMMRRIARAESGAAIVELALVLPVLMAVLMGIIEVGRYAYLGIVAAHAARSGAETERRRSSARMTASA